MNARKVIDKFVQKSPIPQVSALSVPSTVPGSRAQQEKQKFCLRGAYPGTWP